MLVSFIPLFTINRNPETFKFWHWIFSSFCTFPTNTTLYEA